MGEYPSLVVNYYRADDWGLTDRDGVSQIGSTRPLVVEIGDEKIQVYTIAYTHRRIAIPYYYLEKNNKADSFVSAASTVTTENGRNFGDVISYMSEGATLANGEVTEGEICFFGIVKSKYWTPEVNDLLRDCVDFVLDGNEVEDPEVDLEDVKEAMEKYQDVEKAEEDGYASTVECVEVPELGAMGVHYVRGELFDDVIDPLKPEVLLYIPTDTGFRLVAIEYLMPVSGELPEAPMVLGQEMAFHDHLGEEPFPHYALHVWFWEENPDGIFADFNPSLECPLEELEIECLVDEDCGIDGMVGGEFCSEGDVAGLFETFTCNNPGTVDSECVVMVDQVLVEDCSFGCGDAMCLFPLEVECFSDSDCPEDVTSDLFCAIGTGVEIDNVFQNVTRYSCENAGTEESQCVSEENLVLVEVCGFGCEEAMCLLPPEEEEIHDVALIDFTNSIGGIRLELDTVDILEGEELECNLKYKVSVTVENHGDFVEDVTFEGNVGSVDINHNPKNGLEPGKKTLKPKTINFSLSEGFYNISIEAILNGFTDANPEDNFAMRQVFVSCSE